MSGLLGPNGQPISSVEMKKASPPKLGEAFANWAGRDVNLTNLPGNGIVQFDLNQLTLDDFRNMTDHYQVNASLAVLSFLQHQCEWHIECEEKKIADAATEQMQEIWTTLNRSMGTANWAGYSPNALNWENDTESRSVKITKIKDLYPEECEVNWKEIKGWAPPDRPKPKFKIYDGIKYHPNPGWPIPKENSFWFPLLMQNGDYGGRKLLKSAFQSYFFSILIHLFANRYYERFGEPTPLGRAPFDDEIDVDGARVKGNEYLLGVLQQLRNRSVVVLPNDRTVTGSGQNAKSEFDYSIEYLEAQMRGADFERYMTRLDEEISIGLFTPILLFRTADVGSYNLGVGHLQLYQWMLNALNDDRKLHIDKYILRPFVNYNFSEKAPSAKIVYRKLGNSDKEMIKEVLVALVKQRDVKPNLEELGEMAGLSLTQIKQTLEPTPKPESGDDPSTDTKKSDTTSSEARATIKEIVARVKPQVERAFFEHRFNKDLKLNMGFKHRFAKSLESDGFSDASDKTEMFYSHLDSWLEEVVSLGEDEFSSSASFMGLFEKTLDTEIKELEK